LPAWGFGGQYIFVFRELDLVVAITSATTISEERRGYRRQLFDLLENHILPRVTQTPNSQPPTPNGDSFGIGELGIGS
jgi:hypothetical protein